MISLFKKSNIALEVAVIMVFAFILIIGFMITYNIFQDLKPIVQEFTPNQTAAYDRYSSFADNFSSFGDKAIVFCFGLFWVFAIISAFYIDSHPMFFVLSLILLIAIIPVGIIIANAYESVSEALEGDNNFPMTTYLFSHLLGVIVAITLSILLTLFIKNEAG